MPNLDSDLRSSTAAIARNPTDLADDILRGVPAISEFIGIPERQAYYLLARGFLPARKEGKKVWVASRARLRAFYSETTNSAA
jgi:hypothetical protein